MYIYQIAESAKTNSNKNNPVINLEIAVCNRLSLCDEEIDLIRQCLSRILLFCKTAVSFRRKSISEK